jgi:outer membrane protein assembly factor BamB
VRARKIARGSILACTAIVLASTMLIACGGHAGRAATASSSATGAGGAAARLNVPAGDWTQFDYDARRSGVGPASTGITASDLGQLRRRVVHVDGTVDSSAIELHAIKARDRNRDVLVMTTSYGKTIALDAGTGARLWEFTPASIGSYEGSTQVTTATPIADPDRRYVYAASPDGLIHKLALADGHQVRSGHWPARVTFDPTKEKIASALNITGGWVVVGTGGYYGDAPPYQGHVVLLDRSSGRIAHVWNSLCSDRHDLIDPPSSCPSSDSAIWARAGAVVEPGSGRILLATGNGPFNGSTDWGESVLELAPDASRLLHNWTPTNQQQLSSNDTDVGSTAPALLPVVDGLRLAVQGGKDGLLALLDLSRLDGTGGGAGGRTGGELQRISTPGGAELYTQPAVWPHAGRTYVFVADGSGTAAYVLGSGHRLSVAWQNGTPGTSPIVAGGLLYVYDQQDGALVVRRPTDGRALISLSAGTGHWNSPIAVGGRIVLPEGNYMDHATSGVVDIYHLPGK